ncbi:MAG: hypothetical protein ACLP7P_17820 [Rhodomicrobium sp.]
MAPGCAGRFEWAFLRWPGTWQSAHTAQYRSALAEHAPHANVHGFAHVREADNFLASLSR